MSSENTLDKYACCNKKYQENCFLWALAVPPVFFLLVTISDEPFSLLDGISMWPAEFIKILALLLSYFLLRHGQHMVAMGRNHIWKELDLGEKFDGSKGDIHVIWNKYIDDDETKKRRWRVWPVAIGWMIICGAIYLVQTPNIPFRGNITYLVDMALTFLTFWGFVLLFASVSEATMHCRRFIQQLIDKDTVWPFMNPTHQDYHPDALIRSVMREWYEIRLVGMLTDSVSRTVYYPIYIILLLLAAQSDYFDNFDMPASLMLIASLNIFLVLCFSISLRRKAIQARDISLGKINAKNEEIFLSNDDKKKKQVRARLSFYEKKIQEFREGAFLPITEQPWLRALTLMTGGGSSLLLIQYLAG